MARYKIKIKNHGRFPEMWKWCVETYGPQQGDIPRLKYFVSASDARSTTLSFKSEEDKVMFALRWA